MPEYIIRCAAISDVDALIRVDSFAYETEPLPQIYFIESIRMTALAVLVAEIGNDVVGYCTVFVSPTDGQAAFIGSIGVEERHRQNGVASALLRHSFRIIVENGRRMVQLLVDPLNGPANHLYRKLGFGHVASFEDYYGLGKDRDLLRLMI